MNNLAANQATARQVLPPMRLADAASAERIRLLKFVTLFGVGGTEKQVMNLADRLDRERFDLSFGCLKLWGDLLEEVERQQLKVTEYPLRSFYRPNALRQMLRFASDLRQARMQIVHSYNFYANVFSIPAAKFAGVPCVVASIRDMGAYMTPMQQRAQRLMCRYADHVVVNAAAIRTWLVDQGYAPEKISVIRNGLDMRKYGPRNDGAILRRQFWIPAHVPLVVMLSRLNPQKGVEYFLEAAALVRQRCPKAHFLIVGEAFINTDGVFRPDETYRKELQDKAVQLGISDHTRFTGMRSDVPEILGAAAVSVLPSFSEGISNTLLESMAAGAPVVATRVGGTPEIIEDGKHGLLVPPGDAKALADSICIILESPQLAAQLSGEARRRVDAEFSFDNMVRETEDLYMALLQRKTVASHAGRHGYG
jgi:glycosyltransferase involved in cell wall biosynthesis